MKFDWGALIDRLRKAPRGRHQFLAPCPHDRMETVEEKCGPIPVILREMLGHFNGAELFNEGGPFLTLFPISTVPPLRPLEWGEDWYIDKITPKWRESAPNRNDDWPIGMMNYGGLIVYSESRGIKEWDTSEGRWLLEHTPFAAWIEKVISDAEIMMAELELDDLCRKNTTVTTDNETWIIEAGDAVIRKMTFGGIECLSPWETLVYCIWVADYGMRNAGDLDVAADWYPEFHLDARRIAEALSFRLTREAFSLPKSDLEREYLDRFEPICNEIRNGRV
jgi:hypothetical protein